jgi:hypothetical protein
MQTFGMHVHRDTGGTPHTANAHKLIKIQLNFVGSFKEEIQHLGRSATRTKKMRQSIGP